MRKYIPSILIVGSISIAVVILQTVLNASTTSATLADRLRILAVPVTSVKTTSIEPLKVEINLQSTSTNSNQTYGDIWNMALIEREVVLNYRIGAKIIGYSVNLYNAEGQIISTDERAINYEDRPSTFGKSILNNTATANIVSGNLDFSGFKIDKVSVTTINAAGDPGQILEIRLMAKDQDAAGHSMQIFSPSLDHVLYVVQKEYGTYIVLCHVIITDEKGNIIGESVEDTELGETWGTGINIGRPNYPIQVTSTPEKTSSSTNKITTTPIHSTDQSATPTVPFYDSYPAPATPTLHPYP